MKRFCCAAAAALLLLAGCSSQKTIDSPEQLAKDLAEKITYQDELNRMEDALATQIYGVEEVKEIWVYVGSGATAEEAAVIQLDNESAAKKALEKVQERVDDQKSAFESYVPAEVPKLEKAVTAQYGDCVVLSVSDSPEEAQKLIEQHLK